MDRLNLEEFDANTIDKVYRLFDLLQELERHQRLRGRFVLHGGTAINLFMLDVPRLSVDIDIACIGFASRDEMLEEKPSIERAIRQVGEALGYQIPEQNTGHAGTTFILNYQAPEFPDHVKIDINYLNRQPLTELVMRETPLLEGLRVRSFSNEELIGGKAKAFFERVKVRDLYDISNLHRMLSEAAISSAHDSERLHQIILFNASISKRFPFGFAGREARFADLRTDVEEQLYPMLRRSSDFQTLESMIADAKSFIDHWVLPRNTREQEYLDHFEQGEYRPSLLFDDPTLIANAETNPQALWKLANLKKR